MLRGVGVRSNRVWKEIERRGMAFFITVYVMRRERERIECCDISSNNIMIVQALKDECSDLKKKQIKCVLVSCQVLVYTLCIF